MGKRERVKWWGPYGATARVSMAELAATGVLRARFWVRGTIVVAIVVGVLAAAMVWAVPGVVLPWPQLIAGLVAGLAMVAAVIGVSVLAPRHVEVRHEWIQVSQGQHMVRIKREQVRMATGKSVNLGKLGELV
jgi:hypothetical protein